MNFVIQNHVADLVSNSYGFIGEDGLGDEVTIENSMFMQAAAEGIGLYFSSGDFGDNVVGGRNDYMILWDVLKDGEVLKIKNLKKFCRDNKISYSKFYRN